MMQACFGSRPTALLLCFILIPGFGLAKVKKLKSEPGANPPEYAAFARPLSSDQKLIHALDRLTFGPRATDAQELQKLGFETWIELQLRPERLPESPDLEQRLQPYESVRLGIYDIWSHYPAPQLIAAIAHGRQSPPDDPQLRALVLHLVERYVKKRDQDSEKSAQDSDFEPKLNLSSVLTPEQIDTLHSGTPDAKRQLLCALPTEKWIDFAWALTPRERQQLYGLSPVGMRRTLMLTVNPSNVVASDLTETRLLRAIYSTHQLEELMVDFWYNHFNVFIDKGADRFLVPSYEREAIRPHVFDKFYNLLLATAKSPAMLFYLDNAESVGADSPAAQHTTTGKGKRGLNENYGRELMELHTLGVDGGYTQQDVTEVARCFTGWTIAPPRRGGGFEYNDRMHDKGSKVVLGHFIPAGRGIDDGLEVLDILAHHPSTAHFISLEMAKRFVADDPPPSLVNRMAQCFLNTEGDLRQVVRTMIESPEFWSQGAYQAKIKMPFELVASALRASAAEVDSPFPLIAELRRLGEPLYRKLEPTGYKSLNQEWISSAALLERMNFGLAVAQNHLPGITFDVSRLQTAGDPTSIARRLLGRYPTEQTAEAIDYALSQQGPQLQPVAGENSSPAANLSSLVAGLVLGSPEFQRR
jgi:uncharacterized protein (DUF1800 family)